MRSDVARLSLVVLVAAGLLGAPVAGAGGVPPAAAAADAGGLTIDHDGDTVTVANGTSQVISGTADRPTGTELSVRVRSTGNTTPRFLRTENAVVTENGTWAVAFDFPAASAGGTFAVTVATEDGNASTALDGEIVACGEECAEEPPADTPTPRPEQTATPTTSAGAPLVTVDGAVVLTTQGEVATVELRLRGTDTATLRFGNESEVNYALVATVTDENDDGRATLFFDTARAGRSGRTVTVSEADSVTVRSETSLSSTLDPADYPVDIYAGTDADGAPESVATLVVQAGNDGATTTDPGTPAGNSSAPGNTDGSGTTDPSPGAGSGLPGGLGSILLSAGFVVAGGGVAYVLLRE